MPAYYLHRGKIDPRTRYSTSLFEDVSIEEAKGLLEEQEGWRTEDKIHYWGPDNASVEFSERLRVIVNDRVNPNLLAGLITTLDAKYYLEMGEKSRGSPIRERHIQDLLDELSGKS